MPRAGPVPVARGRAEGYVPFMGKRLRETERKYETAAATSSGGRPARPDLAALPSVARTRELEPVRLDAVYYDTPDLALAAHRRTLRVRTGGEDEGWHLKLPAQEADTRTEVHAPVGAAAGKPPEALRTEVTAIVRGKPLAPVVRLRTTRRRTLLLSAGGRTLAEIAYDEVAASDPGAKGPRDAPGTSWAEIEVELVDGTTELLDAVEERFAAAGIRPSSSPSKLARALGDRLTLLPQPPPTPTTAGQIPVAYLHAQLAVILDLDPAVRRDEEDAVHRMRVATRRARSALKSFRRELDRDRTDPLGDELRWLAAVLGTARDREVLAERLRVRLSELDPETVSKALRHRLRAPATDHATAHTALVRELDGPRYFALLDALEALLAAPPYRTAAQAPAREAAVRAVHRDHARLRDRIESALAVPPGDERDVALHEARKDAKRARYCSEAAEPVLGKAAAGHTARMKAVQQLLGEHQDSVMCRVTLAEAAARARAAGEDPAPYRAIDRREREIAADVEERLPGEWRAADRDV